eukprot:TRINITY_DN71475_c0_g3_i1.p1 TRINITY_DN71475_c0_g3~~TRINITY_DN71475_c0_g3_i1.p1  ORF type:complete len:1085 (-),score=296.00 TRINITY_DN71475_c0_g3_i1:406-3660(-)
MDVSRLALWQLVGVQGEEQIDTSSPIEQLLPEQTLVVQKALALNQAIEAKVIEDGARSPELESTAYGILSLLEDQREAVMRALSIQQAVAAKLKEGGREHACLPQATNGAVQNGATTLPINGRQGHDTLASTEVASFSQQISDPGPGREPREHVNSELIRKVNKTIRRAKTNIDKDFTGSKSLSSWLTARCGKRNKAEAADLEEPLLEQAESPGFSRNTSLTSSSSVGHRETGRKSVFPDAEALKQQVRDHIFRPQYNVEDLYVDEGKWQAIARSETFKNLTFAVIAVNTLWIAYDTDYNKASVLCNAPLQFQIGDNLFCAFFTFEIFTRFMSFAYKLDCLTDAWFVFDLFLVIFMIWETWVSVAMYLIVGGSSNPGDNDGASVLRVFRLLRLTRVARLARLLAVMPELMVLIKGLAMAMRSVFSTLVLMVLIMYVFAILCTQLMADDFTGKNSFQTVPKSMNYLMLQGIFADQADFIMKTLDIGVVYYFIVLAYMVVGALTLLNMLIGVICEVVAVVAKVEKESMTLETIKHEISFMLPSIDFSEDGTVTRDDFKKMLESKSAMKALHKVDVDVVSLVDHEEFIFQDEDRISSGTFMSAVIQFRGSNTATVRDCVDIRRHISSELERLHSFLMRPDITPKVGGRSPAARRQIAQPTHSFASSEAASLEVPSEQPANPLRARASIFPDAEQLKRKIKEAIIDDKVYNVEDLYHEDGWCQSIARSDTFKNLTFLVIAVNTIWIAIDTDLNKASSLLDANIVFQVADNVFCIYFSAEILIRFLSFRQKRDAFHDGWFVFDLTLVSLMVWETWVSTAICFFMGSNLAGKHASILRTLRLFRLTRVARLARLLIFLPELMVLVKALVMSVRSVFSTFLLLILVIYVFAILFTQLLSDHEAGKGCFENVPMGMNCLLLQGIFSDQADFITKMLEAYWMYYIIALVYFVLGTLTVLNMLIGVICEVVSVVAQVENEELTVENVKFKLGKVLECIDADNDFTVSKAEFRHILETEEAVILLHEVGVDVIALVEYTDIIFEEPGKSLTLGDFIEIVLQFRGEQNATVKDVVDIRKFTAKELARFESELLRKK